MDKGFCTPPVTSYRLISSLAPQEEPGGHAIERQLVEVEASDGAPLLCARVRCRLCRRTRLAPVQPELRHSIPALDHSLSRLAALLHTCSCGGVHLTDV